jgi:hypothetical protein
VNDEEREATGPSDRRQADPEADAAPKVEPKPSHDEETEIEHETERAAEGPVTDSTSVDSRS